MQSYGQIRLFAVSLLLGAVVSGCGTPAPTPDRAGAINWSRIRSMAVAIRSPEDVHWYLLGDAAGSHLW